MYLILGHGIHQDVPESAPKSSWMRFMSSPKSLSYIWREENAKSDSQATRKSRKLAINLYSVAYASVWHPNFALFLPNDGTKSPQKNYPPTF